MTERDDGVALSWAVRRYLVLIAAVALTCTVLSLVVALSLRRGTEYTATALVIAKELTVRQEQLPRFGESVFNGGSVARAVAAEAGGAVDYRTLVPEKVSMDPVPDTIAFRVQGHSSDAQEAARLANTAAAAFVVQLNKAGAGVGTFSLQDAAYVPLERNLAPVSLPLAGVVGLAAGSILAVVLVAGLVGLRRPVLSAEDAARVVEAPLLAVVTVPRRGDGPGRGVRNLLDRLPTLPSSVVELVGPPGSQPVRRALLSRLPEAAAARTPAAGASRRRLVVTDLLDQTDVALDLPGQLLALHEDALAAVVVVVPEGSARSDIADLVKDFPSDEVVGTVFVRRRSRLRPESGGPVTVPSATESGPRAGATADVPAVLRGGV